MMAVPQYHPAQLSPTVSIQGPLTRKTKPGPGLLVIQDASAETSPHTSRRTLDPEPLQKWAEEGFSVARIEIAAHGELSDEYLGQALVALEEHAGCVAGSVGIIVYSESATSSLTRWMDTGDGLLGRSGQCKAIVSYGPLPQLVQPYLSHVAERGIKETSDNGTIYRYPEARSTSFVLPSHPDYLPASAAVAHSRTLEFLKKQLGGPWFDLEAIWEEHTRLEFAERAVQETMDTMVAEPYVNHVPTMTGGIGRRNLTSFYAKHFIFSNPADTELQLISRTVGVDRVVDEFIFSLTHDRVIDWL